MCLAVPGKIIDIFIKNNLKMCNIDFGGSVREACLDLVPEAKVGDYTIIHVGFAMSIISEEEAQKTIDMIKEISEQVLDDK
jgi:hydrogenase expression/formation protein HypC